MNPENTPDKPETTLVELIEGIESIRYFSAISPQSKILYKFILVLIPNFLKTAIKTSN